MGSSGRAKKVKVEIAGIYEGVRKRRSVKRNNDDNLEEPEHDIHPLGCGHKAIHGALKKRKQLILFLVLLILPYFLAFIAACSHLRLLKRKETYEVEEVEEEEEKEESQPIVQTVQIV